MDVEQVLTATHCVKSRQRDSSGRARNLVLVTRPKWKKMHADFRRIARQIRKLDPLVHPMVLWDSRYTLPRPSLFLRPTMVVSPLTIRHLTWCPGVRYQAALLTKSEEYVALEKCGIPVPKWVRLTRDNCPSVESLGAYVVCKPDAGAKGAEVKIKRAGRVRWKAPANKLARRIGSDALLAQDFI